MGRYIRAAFGKLLRPAAKRRGACPDGASPLGKTSGALRFLGARVVLFYGNVEMGEISEKHVASQARNGAALTTSVMGQTLLKRRTADRALS